MLNNEDRRIFPGIGPRDPRNLLSHEARIRLDDAVFLQQSIRDSALANIVARCGDDWDDWDGAAKAQWSDAKVRAGVAGLSPLCRELMAIGKHGSELTEVMRGELDGYANSCELSGLEKKAVFSQLWLVLVEEQAKTTVREICQKSADLPESDRPSQTEADRRFGTEEQREAEVRRAKEQFGTIDKVASWIGVHYSDLRKWVVDRGESLAKGRSAKVDKIEQSLLSI